MKTEKGWFFRNLDKLQNNLNNLNNESSYVRSHNNIIHTFPSFARDDGSGCHETLPSVHFLLGETLTKLAKFRLLVISEDFFTAAGRCFADLSESSAAALAVLFFMRDWILLSSLGNGLSFVNGFCRGACKLEKVNAMTPEWNTVHTWLLKIHYKCAENK